MGCGVWRMSTYAAWSYSRNCQFELWYTRSKSHDRVFWPYGKSLGCQDRALHPYSGRRQWWNLLHSGELALVWCESKYMHSSTTSLTCASAGRSIGLVRYGTSRVVDVSIHWEDTTMKFWMFATAPLGQDWWQLLQMGHQEYSTQWQGLVNLYSLATRAKFRK